MVRPPTTPSATRPPLLENEEGSTSEINPQFPEALYNLGNTLKDLGQLDAAADCYQRALQFIPHNALVHNNPDAVLQEFGRDAEAELSFRRALNIEPKYADAQYNLDNTLQNLERVNEAETCYQRALCIQPDFTAALNALRRCSFHKANRYWLWNSSSKHCRSVQRQALSATSPPASNTWFSHAKGVP